MTEPTGPHHGQVEASEPAQAFWDMLVRGVETTSPLEAGVGLAVIGGVLIVSLHKYRSDTDE